ncbi:30S ribosomal protein S24e [Candidatus Woesearchaeota archaeon]|nr:30S ribosomal protein S24e [Candidatus Woesearchaeota archaeon]
MNITINTTHENKLLERSEIDATVVFEGATPSTTDVTMALAAQLKKDLEVVVVKHLHTIFGRREAKVEAFVYHSPTARKRFEVITAHMIKKAAEAQKAEAPA